MIQALLIQKINAHQHRIEKATGDAPIERNNATIYD
jgi:hypothetical protein